MQLKRISTGLICDGDNIESIYENVIKFFKNDDYKKYGNNAEKFSENFYWKIIIKKYLKLI